MIQWGEWKWTFDELRALREAQLLVLMDSEKRAAMDILRGAVEELRREYQAAEENGVTEGEIRAALASTPFVCSDPRKQSTMNGLAKRRNALTDAVGRVSRIGLTGRQVTLLLRLKKFGGSIDD